MVLTTAQKAKITSLINYYGQGSAGKASADDVIAVELSKIFQGQGSFPATGHNRSFYDRIRETPITTLLHCILDAAA